MADQQRHLKVFLSHASQDKPAVRELSQRLFAEGWIKPWLDEKELLPGQDWRIKIEEAVEAADVVIICLSSHSVSKEGFVQKELRYAREIALEKPEETIFLIPLRLNQCNVPRGLRFYQWADYFGEKKNETYAALVKSLKMRHEQVLLLEVECAQKQTKLQEREAVEKLARANVERETTGKAVQQEAKRESADRNTKARAGLEGTAGEVTQKDAPKKGSRARTVSIDQLPVAAAEEGSGCLSFYLVVFVAVLLIIVMLVLLALNSG
jgi:hypothetical protein